MADIITKDSEEFKELTGWIRRAGKAAEEATARIRPTIADEHYLTGDDVCERLHISRRTLQTLRDENMVSTWCPILPSVERFFIPKADCMRC